MSMELDRICTVDISLATPISDNASFDNILILGPAPAKPKGSIEAVAAYSGLPLAKTLTRLVWLHVWRFPRVPNRTMFTLPFSASPTAAATLRPP